MDFLHRTIINFINIEVAISNIDFLGKQKVRRLIIHFFPYFSLLFGFVPY